MLFSHLLSVVFFLLQMYDADDSGFISREELAEMLKVRGPWQGAGGGLGREQDTEARRGRVVTEGMVHTNSWQMLVLITHVNHSCLCVLLVLPPQQKVYSMFCLWYWLSIPLILGCTVRLLKPFRRIASVSCRPSPRSSSPPTSWSPGSWTSSLVLLYYKDVCRI